MLLTTFSLCYFAPSLFCVLRKNKVFRDAEQQIQYTHKARMRKSETGDKVTTTIPPALTAGSMEKKREYTEPFTRLNVDFGTRVCLPWATNVDVEPLIAKARTNAEHVRNSRLKKHLVNMVSHTPPRQPSTLISQTPTSVDPVFSLLRKCPPLLAPTGCALSCLKTFWSAGHGKR